MLYLNTEMDPRQESEAMEATHDSSMMRRFAGGTGRLILILVGAVIIGLGVPALWFWIGAQLGGGHTPDSYTSPVTFAAILPGIVITYLIVLDVCAWLYNRTLSDEDVRSRAWPVRRASWNRSMRDQRYRPGESRLSSIELMFVLTTTGVSIAFTIWFFFFAKSPL
jgi:hypothetical protein